MKARYLYLCALLALPLSAFGQVTGYTITGGLSNFDCTNRCDYPCDEMEIEIEGIRPEDVTHTYHNSNYGSPTVTLSPDGTRTIIDYRNPAHLTNVGVIEHYGVCIAGQGYTGGPPLNRRIRIRWFRSGQPATVNGQIPNPETGGSAPATQPIMPSISGSITAGSHGTGGANLTVTNNDPAQAIWIKRSAQILIGTVTLEALMPTDPVVTGSVQIDGGPVYLAPGQTMVLSSDFIEAEEVQSAVFSAQYFQNLRAIGPFASNEVGPELGNVMTATIASPQLVCEHSMPTIISQPENVTVDPGERVDIRVQGRGDDLTPLVYRWMRDGVDLVNGNGVSGADSAHLRIASLDPSTEGFYTVRISNPCATIVSQSALVFMTGHNVAPIHVSDCPTFTMQPASTTVCADVGGTMQVGVTGTETLDFRWRCMTATGACGNLSDGIVNNPATGLTYWVSGSSTPTMTVSNISMGNHVGPLMFAVRVSNDCGLVTSETALMTVVGTKCQASDLAWDTGDLLPPFGGCGLEQSNAGVNEADYNAFFQGFFDAAGYCDIADDAGQALAPFGAGGGPGSSNTGVNEGDYNCFFQLFFNGCP